MGWSGPDSLAFDAAGNLYVANYNAGTVSKVPAGGGAPTTYVSGLSNPHAVAFDAAWRNLYIANATRDRALVIAK